MVVFDAEHGVFDNETLDRLVPFCTAIGLIAMVRLAEASRPTIQAALDMGSAGVILPQINDLDHAARVSALAKFPPLGLRGYSRTTRHDGATPEFAATENSVRLCYVMIETAGALADARGIAALSCVDGLFIGPGDLSLDRGRDIFRDTAEDSADLRIVAKAAKDAGKRFAAAGPTRHYAEQAADLGAPLSRKAMNSPP